MRSDHEQSQNASTGRTCPRVHFISLAMAARHAPRLTVAGSTTAADIPFTTLRTCNPYVISCELLERADLRLGKSSSDLQRGPKNLGALIALNGENMKPDDLIGMPSANAERMGTGGNTGKIAAAIVGGAAISLAFIIFVLGIRPDLQDADIMALVAARLAFSLGMVALSSVFLARLAGPGLKLRSMLALTSMPFLGVMVLAVVGMAADPNWEQIISGDQWRECALAVPIITVVPFAAIMWAVRLAAPVNPAQTGAIAGLTASAISVTAFALHCTIDPAPLVALWFGGTGILCMLSGAKLGPRLFRR